MANRPAIEHQVVVVPMAMDLIAALNGEGKDGWIPWGILPGQTPDGRPAMQVLVYREASPIISLTR